MSKLTTYAIIFFMLCTVTISIARDYLCDDLLDPENQYDYIVISGSESVIYPYVKPLMDWRYEEGFSPLFVDVHQIYSAFPDELELYDDRIQRFMIYARENWEICPEYLFLVGNDWENGGYSSPFFAPTHEINGFENGEITNDTYYAENYDNYHEDRYEGWPFFQVGRLNPNGSLQNIENYCSKVIDYESNMYRGYSRTPVIITHDSRTFDENYESGNYTSDNLDSKGVLHEMLHQIDFRYRSAWNRELVKSINSGQSLILYHTTGHEGNVVGLPSMSELYNDRYFISLMTACNATDFHLVGDPPLTQTSEYLVAEDKGAVGFICASSRTYTINSRPLINSMLDLIYDRSRRDERKRLGNIFTETLRSVSSVETEDIYKRYRTFNVMADPALLINVPMMPQDGYITTDTVWSGSVSLTHDVLIPRGKTLTLLPGTTIEAELIDTYEYGYLDGHVGDAQVELIVEGELIIEGTEDNPVVITGDFYDGWGGILVRKAGEINGSNLLVKNAEWGIHLQDGGEAHLTDSLIYDCDRGVFAHGRRVSFSGLNIENCGIGVYVDNGEDLEGNEIYKTQVKVRDCYLTNNQRGIRIWRGLSFDAGTVDDPGNNVVSGNRVMDFSFVYDCGLIEASFVGNAWGTFSTDRVDDIFDYAQDHIPNLEYLPFKVAGVLGEDETVPSPSFIDDSVTLDGDLIVPDGLTLTISAGCTIETTWTDITDMTHGGSDSQKAELIVESGGSLVSNGTVQNPIHLNSIREKPCSWYGIRFEEGSTGSIQHTVIEDAIYGVESSSSPQLDHVELRECSLAGYRSLAGSGELTNCYIHDNDDPEIFEGEDYGHGVIATMGSEVSLRNCEITDNAGDGVRVLDGSPDLGSYESLGWNIFNDNEGLDISYESGVAPGGSLIARGNEFGTIDGIELDQRVSDSVNLSPVVFGGTVDHGSDLPFFEPGEENLPVCYVDRDVYLVDDFTAEPAVISFGPGGEVLEYFELRFAPNVKVGMAPQQETEAITPDDPLLVDVLIDVPCFFEEPEEGVSSIAVEPSGGFIPSPWEIGESQLPEEFSWGEFTFGEHCLELDWHEALIDGATSVKMDSGQFDESNPANFERVFIRNIAGVGFELMDGAASFRRCYFSNNLGNGLQLNSGTWAKLYRCEISGNDGDGIYLASGAEIDLGIPVGGDEPMIGLNYFANNAGFDLNNKSGSPVAAHGNQWSESDWELIRANSINNPGGMDYSYLFPIAWSGVLKSGNTLGECNWLGNMLLLGDVTVPVGMLAGQPFVLNFETPSGAEGIEIAELPGLDSTHGGEDPNKSEFRINGLVSSEDPIHLTRLSLPTIMFGEFPPPEPGEWTGLIVASPDQLTLNEYNVRWAETGIQVIGGGLTTLSNCEVTDSNTAVVLEGVSPTLFGNELHAEIEGLVCSDNSWPILADEPNSNSFYLDFNLTTLPSHFYIANRNAAIFPGDPTTIDATLCKWYDAAGENQEPEDWMFDGDVTYESTTMLAENSSQIASEDNEEKTELDDHKDSTDLANDEETTAIELDNSDDSIGVSTGNISLIDEESVMLESDESTTLANDSLEAASLEAEYLSSSTSSFDDATQLLSVVPNPTTGMITISIELAGSQRVELSLYDLAGRLVETIHRGLLSEGRHSLSYDTAGITGGLYLLHLSTSETTETIRLAIVR